MKSFLKKILSKILDMDNDQAAMAGMTAAALFGLAMAGACVPLAISDWHRASRLDAEDEAAHLAYVAQQQTAVELLRAGYVDRAFTSNLSNEDLTLWAAAVNEAEETTGLSYIKEIADTDREKVIPIVVHFQPVSWKEQSVAYTCVVGTRTFKDGKSVITPCFALYEGYRGGGLIRLNSVESPTVEIYKNGEWVKTDPHGLWKMSADSVRRNLTIRLQNSF